MRKEECQATVLRCKLEACAQCRENSQEWGHALHPLQAVGEPGGPRPGSHVKRIHGGLAGLRMKALQEPGLLFGKASAPSSGRRR